MTLPPRVRERIAADLGARVGRTIPVGGGCISPAYRVELDGRVVFVKVAGSDTPRDMFEQEAHSLHAIRAAHCIRVPEVFAADADCIVLEWLEPGRADDAAWRRLGAGLARLHRGRGGRAGWDADNYIGPLPQRNAPASSWAEFWRERRLRPQLERADAVLDAVTMRRFDALLVRLDEMLGEAEEEGVSLLHGDLWSGNAHALQGDIAVIDPSSYYGHREVDLAMAALFGGFPAGFRAGYEVEWPLRSGSGHRECIYQLYYLLVHVNLFGAGYVPSTERTLAQALG